MRRRCLLVVPLLLAGCGLSERPYVERRQWSLQVPRPAALPARPGGRVLLVRSVSASPGLETRGLQSRGADGTVHTDPYEEWFVPPAEGVEDALRQWLAASGRFAAVLAPGSRVSADLVLEGQLVTLCSIPAEHRAQAVLALTLLDHAAEATPRIRLQRSIAADAPLAGADAGVAAQAMCAALAGVFAQAERLPG
jgi:ABC-type uncharacterized transport system auxiliary subunit